MSDLMTNPRALQIERNRLAAAMLQQAQIDEDAAPRRREYVNTTSAQVLRDWAAKLIANDFEEAEG